MAQFYTLLTDVGQAKLANAIALGQTIEITELAVGDGNGSLPTPDSSAEALVNEVRRAPINTSTTDPDNPSWIVVEQVLPPDVGGWTVREIGIFDIDGDLIGVGNYPETYKPVLSEGSSRTQTVRFVLEVSDTAAVTLKVDPSVVLATREYVDEQRAAHEASRNHPAATTEDQGMVELATSAEVRAADAVRAVTAEALKKSGLLGGAVTIVEGVTAGTSHSLTAEESGLVLVDAANGDVTLNLPAANGAGGVRFTILRIDASHTYTASINRSGTDLIYPGSAGVVSVSLGPRVTRELAADGIEGWNLVGSRAKKGGPTNDGSDTGYAFEADGDTGLFAEGGNPVSQSDLVLRVDGEEAGRFMKTMRLDAQNGWARLSSGQIIQWGEVSLSVTGGTANSWSFTFPIAFPNACHQAFAVSGSNAASDNGLTSEGKSKTGFNGFYYADGSRTQKIRVFAIGS